MLVCRGQFHHEGGPEGIFPFLEQPALHRAPLRSACWRYDGEVEHRPEISYRQVLKAFNVNQPRGKSQRRQNIFSFKVFIIGKISSVLMPWSSRSSTFSTGLVARHDMGEGTDSVKRVRPLPLYFSHTVRHRHSLWRRPRGNREAAGFPVILRRPADAVRQQVFRQPGGLAGPGCQRFQQRP